MLHPGRKDLGVGRAFAGPVADIALQRHRDGRRVDDYGDQVFELLSWITRTMPPGHQFASLDLAPDVPGWPEMLLLGSSQSSPHLAAQLGLPYVFAGFISPQGAVSALSNYRQGFRPSQVVGIEKPHTIFAVHVVCADTTEEAERLAMPVRHMYATLSSGKLERRLSTPEQAIAYFGNVVRAEDDPWPRFVIGDPARVRSMLERMIEQTRPAASERARSADRDPAHPFHRRTAQGVACGRPTSLTSRSSGGAVRSSDATASRR